MVIYWFKVANLWQNQDLGESGLMVFLIKHSSEGIKDKMTPFVECQKVLSFVCKLFQTSKGA